MFPRGVLILWQAQQLAYWKEVDIHHAPVDGIAAKSEKAERA